MKEKDLIEEFAEGLADFYPLPDITPLQKQINRLYVKLRICGMPPEEVSKCINELLQKHGITNEQVLYIPTNAHRKNRFSRNKH